MRPALFSNLKTSMIAAVIGVIGLCLPVSFLFAQASLSTHTLILPDTAYLGSTDTVFVTIKNVGDTSYTGPVTIYFATDTVTYSPFSLCSGSSITLNPSDTIQAMCYADFNTPDFNTGNNIVVVWSSGNMFAIPADTAKDSVYVLPPLSSVTPHSNYFQDNSFILSPSISATHIYLEYSAPLLVKDQIRLFDVYGRRVYAADYSIAPSPKSSNGASLDISRLKQGIYFVELCLPDNRKLVRKFVKAGM